MRQFTVRKWRNDDDSRSCCQIVWPGQEMMMMMTVMSTNLCNSWHSNKWRRISVWLATCWCDIDFSIQNKVILWSPHLKPSFTLTCVYVPLFFLLVNLQLELEPLYLFIVLHQFTVLLSCAVSRNLCLTMLVVCTCVHVRRDGSSW